MPTYRNPFEKGNLVITFEVEYPTAEWFSIAENRDALARLLPPKQDQGKAHLQLFKNALRSAVMTVSG